MHEGRLCGVEVVAVVCGVCKVNAAIASQLLIDDFAVGAILNSGTAGGMDPRLRILDTVSWALRRRGPGAEPQCTAGPG